MRADRGEIKSAGINSISDLLGGHAGFSHCVADIIGSTAAEKPFFNKVIDDHIGKGNFELVHAVNSEQTADSTLNRYRSVQVDKILSILGNMLCRLPCLVHKGGIKVKF